MVRSPVLQELCKWMTQIAVTMLWNLTTANVLEERRTNTWLSDKEDITWLDLRFEDSVRAELDMKLILSLSEQGVIWVTYTQFVPRSKQTPPVI